MATGSYSLLRTLHHHHHHSLSRRHHSIDCLRPHSNSSSLLLNPTNSITNNASSSSTSFPITSSSSSSSYLSFSPFPITSSSSSSAATAAATAAPSSTSTTQPPISFDVLEQYLTAQNFRQADEETRRLLIALAGEAAVKRGYVFFSEVQYIQESDLKSIDSLWTKHSDNKFGYSVQKRLWEKCNRDFTKLFIKLGWMKKLDTELEQYNYKSFPTEFFWELKRKEDQEEEEETPEGHLPLTNALRGTQLFQNILLHPAFDDESNDNQKGRENKEEEEENSAAAAAASKGSNVPNLIKRIFKPNYSF